MTQPIEIKQESTFNFMLVLALFTTSAFWISKSILFSGGVGLLLWLLFLLIRKQGLVFTEKNIIRIKLFDRKVVYEYNQLIQLEAIKTYYTNFARYALHFTIQTGGKKIKLKYFLDRYAVGRQVVKLVEEKNIKIIYRDEHIRKVLAPEL